ncbi:hypothetical protein KUTeg_007891 [Tegillarca granosa]|uniref:SAM-dependent MTase RsmB/NOP-type domain-containing protein n=1 Tax=Tegillarca granosa TaxID=220873 RepID=A0ABQ9FEL3_TEGGR|nr:hypothetical protein KUTeg_007891 [Tegillarca granosa]
MEHFDMFYRPVYGDLWPLLRISLLSPKKYCAVVNNFASNDKVVKNLSDLGAFDIIKNASKKFQQNYDKEFLSKSDNNIAILDDGFDNIDEKSILKEESPEMSDDYLPPIEEKNTGLYDFVPVKKTYTNKEKFQMEEIQSSVYRSSDFEVQTVKSLIHSWPYDNLKVFTYDPGNIESFASPKKGENGLYEYYLMDAASILPVIALDLEVNDRVLDLCSAPGGKALTIFQTLITDDIACNDKSVARLKRVESIIDSYLDSSVTSKVKLYHMDGKKFTEPSFDKLNQYIIAHIS